MQDYIDSVDWLHHELTNRQQKNPAYSMRAFAKLLGTSPGRLSEYLSRKRDLSDRVTCKFVDQVASDNELNLKIKKSLLKDESDCYQIADPMQLATRWYHYAILSLVETRDFNPDPLFIAKRLGIPVNQVRHALHQLESAGLIEITDKGIVLLNPNTTTVTDIPSAVIRESQKESMRRTIERLDDIPIHLRDISSMTMAIDSSRIPQAKIALKKFRRSLAKLLEAGEQNEVYELNIQLVPLTERKN